MLLAVRKRIAAGFWARTLWALLRPQTYLLMSIYVLFGLLYGLAQTGVSIHDFVIAQGLALISIMMALALWYIAATSLNDLADFKIDQINLKYDQQRPLVQGKLTKRQLVHIAVGSSFASVLLSALSLNPLFVLLFALLLLLNVVYSLPPVQISHRGVFAPLLLPLGYVGLTLTSGLLLSGAAFDIRTICLILALYLHFMARIILKDHRDVVGDKKFGKQTMVLRYGNRLVVQACGTLFIVSSLLFVGVFWESYRLVMPFVVFFASGAVVVLGRLAAVEDWPHQRPLITSFGRLCSGIVTVLSVALLADVVGLYTYQTVALLAVVTALLYVSLFEIFALQNPGTSVARADKR